MRIVNTEKKVKNFTGNDFGMYVDKEGNMVT